MSASFFLQYLKPPQAKPLSSVAERWRAWRPGDAPLHPVELVTPHVSAVVKNGEVREWQYEHPLIMLLRTQNIPAIEAYWDPRPFSPEWPAKGPDDPVGGSLSDLGHWGVWQEAFGCDSLEPLRRLMGLVPLSVHPQHRGGRWGHAWSPWEGFGQAVGLSNEELAQRLEMVCSGLVGTPQDNSLQALRQKVLWGAARAGHSDRALFLVDRFGLTETIEPAALLLEAGDVTNAWKLLAKSPGFSPMGAIDTLTAYHGWDAPVLANRFAEVMVRYMAFEKMAMAKKLPAEDRVSHSAAIQEMGLWLLRSVASKRWRRKHAAYTDNAAEVTDPDLVRLLLGLDASALSGLQETNPSLRSEVLASVLMEKETNGLILDLWLPSITSSVAEKTMTCFHEKGLEHASMKKLQFSSKQADLPQAQCALLYEWIKPLQTVVGFDFLAGADRAAEGMGLTGWAAFRPTLRADALEHTLPATGSVGPKPRF